MAGWPRDPKRFAVDRNDGSKVDIPCVARSAGFGSARPVQQLPEGFIDGYHVVSGRYPSARIINAEPTLTTLQGGDLELRIEQDAVKINDATVVATDVRATNGVIHVIDTVLLPPDDEQAENHN